jgi:hypothetical protein
MISEEVKPVNTVKAWFVDESAGLSARSRKNRQCGQRLKHAVINDVTIVHLEKERPTCLI